MASEALSEAQIFLGEHVAVSKCMEAMCAFGSLC